MGRGLGVVGVLLAARVVAAGPSPLVAAVQAGEAGRVRALLGQAGAVNGREADGTTALHWAVRGDQVALVRLLLGAQADANVADRYGVTPLMLAAGTGDAAVVQALVRAGADVNAALPEGQTVLMTAARTGQPAVVQALVQAGAEVNAAEQWLGETALMWAAAENHAAAVQVLLAAGADPNQAAWPTTFRRKLGGQTILPRGGFTALLYAARQGAGDAVAALVAGGADPNRGDPDGVTALLVALINAHYEVAAWLLAHGADPNQADGTGMTPLYAAVDMHTLPFMHGRPDPKPTGPLTAGDLVTDLLARGAAVDAPLRAPTLQRHNNAPNQLLGEGTTPLMRAAKAGDVALMQVLLAHGAVPTRRQANQTTLLMLAAGLGRRFDQNADAQEFERGTAAELFAAVQLCLSLGLEVNAANDAGDTALHVAVSDEIVRALVAHGARLDATNKDGKTPLDVALTRKDRSGRQLLPDALAALRALSPAHSTDSVLPR